MKIQNLGESVNNIGGYCAGKKFEMRELSDNEKDEKVSNYIKELFNPEKYHTFSLTPNLLQVLELTDNKVFSRPMPFDRMYMPLLFKTDTVVVNGIMAVHIHHGICEEDADLPPIPGYEDNIVIIRSFEYTDKSGEERTLMSNHIITKHGTNNRSIKAPKHIRKDCKEIIKQTNRIFFNIIDFLNHPDVEYRVINPTNNAKRKLKGKPPMPPRIKITVYGKLKKYLNAVEARSEKISYSHSFWVRGHFRHLTSDYYTSKQGKAIWIAPFIKGDGELIKKMYELKKG